MGKIELDHTGSGSGVTLSSDGTDLLLDGTAIGGGGAALELYAENPSSATDPSAVGNNSVAIGSGSVSGSAASDDNAVAISTSATVSGSDGIAIGRLTSAAQYGTAIGRLSVASAYGSTALGANTDATANEAVAIGWTAQSTGVAAVALGNSYASGADSFAAAIASNSSSYGATGANSVAIGYQAKATGEAAYALGRITSASGDYSTCLGNSSYTTSNATYSVSMAASYVDSPYSLGFGGGSQIYSGNDYSIVLGRGAKSRIKGGVHFGGANCFSAGQNQTGIYILGSDTTDATAEALTTNNSTPSTDNQIVLPNNSVYSFHGTVVARQDATDGSACAAWEVKGLIRREANAGTTTLVNSATTILDNTPSWGMALSADTTNGGLKIEVTGAASTNIKFLATVHTTELTYN